MGTEWVKLSADGKRIEERAPKCYARSDGLVVPATEREHREHGYLRLVDENPTVQCEEGFHLERAEGYDVNDGVAYPRYSIVANPLRVRTFSKLRLWSALSACGKWSAFKAWLDSTGYAEAWNLAQNLAEDYDGWNDIVAAAQSALGMTDEELSAILDAAEVAG